jgi:hypothetical protein
MQKSVHVYVEGKVFKLSMLNIAHSAMSFVRWCFELCRSVSEKSVNPALTPNLFWKGVVGIS